MNLITREFQSNPLLPLYISIFIDLLGVGIVIPLVPYYASALGADPAIYGLLGTIYGFAQLIGSPLMGKLSDQHGRRTVMLISLIGSGIGYFMMGFANNLWVLFLSRIPVGLVKQTMSVSKAYISDVSGESSRAKHMGYIGTAAGIGFIIGPLLGGFLSNFGHSFPAFVASFLFFLDFLFVFFFLKESKTKVQSQKESIIDFHSVKRILQDNQIRLLMIIHFLYSIGLLIVRSNFSVYAQYRFGVTARDNGMILSYVGVLDVLVRTFAIGRLTRTFTEQQLIFFSVINAGVSCFALGVAITVPHLLLALIPFALATSVMHTCLSSLISTSVKSDDIGVSLGLLDSLESLCRVMSPSIGGILFEHFGASAPPFVSSLLSFPLGVLVYWKLSLSPKRNPKKNEEEEGCTKEEKEF